MKHENMKASSDRSVADVIVADLQYQIGSTSREIIEIDPRRVRVWEGNPRSYEKLTYDTTFDLIEGIKAEGGQKIPAMVRRVHDNEIYDFEVIAGSRRHFAISWLRENGHPALRFVAVVETVTDEEAFRLTELENRVRQDVTDLERAKAYAHGLATYYSNQTEMAAALGISQPWLSKHVSVAAMPEAIFAAFASECDIQVKVVYPVAQKWREAENRAALIEKAVELAGEQRRRSVAGEKPLMAKQVVTALLSVTKQAAPLVPEISLPLVRSSVVVGDTWHIELRVDPSIRQSVYLKELRKLVASQAVPETKS